MHNPKIPNDLIECYYLRNVVLWMQEHPERVNLDSFMMSPDRRGCVLCWFAHNRHAMHVWEWLGVDVFNSASEVFGLTRTQSLGLFDTLEWVSLEDRAALLDKIIAAKEAALGKVKGGDRLLALYQPSVTAFVG